MKSKYTLPLILVTGISIGALGLRFSTLKASNPSTPSHKSRLTIRTPI
jgi:hypothetical protein